MNYYDSINYKTVNFLINYNIDYNVLPTNPEVNKINKFAINRSLHLHQHRITDIECSNHQVQARTKILEIAWFANITMNKLIT